MELPLAVFGSLSEPTGGSAIAMLSRFERSWPHIDQATNEMASDIFDAHTSALREEMVKFFKAALEGSHQREDRGILETQFDLQGGAKGARVSFQAPGAFHHAHLMVKAIFSIKIFLFQQLFSPTAKEKHSVMELVLFVSLFYVRFWHEAPLPETYLLLLEELSKYLNMRVAKVASTAFSRHIWYV